MLLSRKLDPGFRSLPSPNPHWDLLHDVRIALSPVRHAVPRIKLLQEIPGPAVVGYRALSPLMSVRADHLGPHGRVWRERSFLQICIWPSKRKWRQVEDVPAFFPLPSPQTNTCKADRGRGTSGWGGGGGDCQEASLAFPQQQHQPVKTWRRNYPVFPLPPKSNWGDEGKRQPWNLIHSSAILVPFPQKNLLFVWKTFFFLLFLQISNMFSGWNQ